MITMPRTTYTFNAYTYDEQTTDTTDVKVEWTTQEEQLQELCEKFADFVRGAGFSYVTGITYETSTAEDSKYYAEDDNISFPDWDFSSEQPEIDESQIELDLGPAPSPEPGYGYRQHNNPYGWGINSATPDEWNAVSQFNLANNPNKPK